MILHKIVLPFLFLFVMGKLIFSPQVFMETSRAIVVYGDNRTNHDVHKRIVKEIIKIKPITVFNTGDLVEDGFNQAEWQIFNQEVAPITDISEYYPVLGNHERESKQFFSNFELPNNERWYSLDRQGIHFIILDTNFDLDEKSEQYQWLIEDLSNIDKKVNYVIAIFHYPPFSTGKHKEDEKNLRKKIIPLFEKNQVDMVFSGHEHNYERSNYRDIYFIVTGGGGAPLYDQTRTNKYSQKFIKKYHFCKLTIFNQRLIVEVFDSHNKHIDQFEIVD